MVTGKEGLILFIARYLCITLERRSWKTSELKSCRPRSNWMKCWAHFSIFQFSKHPDFLRLSLQCANLLHYVWRSFWSPRLYGSTMFTYLRVVRSFCVLPESFIPLIELKILFATSERIETVLSNNGFHCFLVSAVQWKLVTSVIKYFLGIEAEDFCFLCQMLRKLCVTQIVSDRQSIAFITCNHTLLGVSRRVKQLFLALWEGSQAASFLHIF